MERSACQSHCCCTWCDLMTDDSWNREYAQFGNHLNHKLIEGVHVSSTWAQNIEHPVLLPILQCYTPVCLCILPRQFHIVLLYYLYSVASVLKLCKIWNGFQDARQVINGSFDHILLQKKMLHAICDFRAQYVWVFILRNDTFLWDKKLPVAPPHLACSEPLDTCKCIINLNGLLSKPGHVIFEFFTYSMFYSHQWSQVALKGWMLENQVNCDSLSVIITENSKKEHYLNSNPSSAKIRRRD